MSIRILQFGATGQLAVELLRQAPAHPVEILALWRQDADLADPAACAAKVAEARPDLVVIAAAYTAVDKAESEPQLADRINGEAPGAADGRTSRRAISPGFSSTSRRMRPASPPVFCQR